MTKLFVILLVALTFETAGVIMLSKGLRHLRAPERYRPAEIGQFIVRAVSDKNIVLGVLFEAIFFAGLLLLMANGDVSFVWPLTSLTFVFSTIAAKYYLEEQIANLRWLGVVFIVCGAGLITYTEKMKKQPAPTAQPAGSSGQAS